MGGMEEIHSQDRIAQEAHRQDKKPSEVCPNKKEHAHIRGDVCDTCDTYFRGDSMS